MKPVLVDVPYSRTFPFPADRAYGWLTDYEDTDPSLTTTVVKERKVVERRGNVVVMDGRIDILGSGGSGRVEVHLFPQERRWEARIVEGRARGSVYSYQLTSLGPDACRLDIHYRTPVRRWRSRLKVTLARPLIRRELRRMWDGFASGMERDLRP